jgi:hypothetical protein
MIELCLVVITIALIPTDLRTHKTNKLLRETNDILMHLAGRNRQPR